MLRIPGSFFVIAIAAILALSPCSVACEVPEAKPDTLVVCPLPFQQAMVKWCGYREQQGHIIKMVEPPASVEALKRTIRQVAKSGSLKHVLIVGDVRGPRGLKNVTVPTDFVEAKVGVLFGSDPEIATDNPYADLNLDGLPDLSIGRWTRSLKLRITLRGLLNTKVHLKNNSGNGGLILLQASGGLDRLSMG